MSEKVLLRKRVYKFYENNIQQGKKYTIDHFVAEGESKRTIYSIIKRFEDGIDANQQPGAGKPPNIFHKKGLNKLKRLTNNKSGVSQRNLAEHFKCTQPYISKVLNDKLGINCYKKMKIPDRTFVQMVEARSKCRFLYYNYKDRDWVLDDESYFTLSHSTINGNGFYYTDDKNNAPASIKYAKSAKFEAKVLVWIAFSARGFSEPLVRESGFAVNQYVYKEECLEARLIPFLKEHHSDQNYIFWPDLANAHYAKSVMAYLDDNNVAVVAKKNNPANVPECRPIEDFWSQLKAKVYENNWSASDTNQLRSRIKKCLNEFDMKLVQDLLAGVKSRLDHVRRHGTIEDD